ncbi:hypothetical protein [Caldinitratiruptor microaerophilus]|uniref:Uncharacterized protein n=1 Tax=Caldinitratiruptor microaerophilus TaxID=671077 RepID=A0AA35CLL4_9FIRM|nr:hypothetical protein [Caldinitratiruptor microaerophilus]BDG60774.1 hypothetical protein caldi_18640 [Caldinitratiruptor microaerophilus]
MHEETVAGVPLPVLVAITAAVAAVLDTEPGRVAIRSVRPVAGPAAGAGNWAVAGRMQQHLSRLQPLRRGW